MKDSYKIIYNVNPNVKKKKAKCDSSFWMQDEIGKNWREIILY